MPRTEEDVVIGKIVGAFGIAGELKVVVLTDFPERLEVGKQVTVKPVNAPSRTARIVGSRAHKGGLLIRLDGVRTREDAEALHSAELVIGPDEVGELAEGSWYIFDLIGLRVTSEDGRECGEVVEVLQGANDVYITSTGLCIPALKDVVAKVDLAEGEMIIRPVPGLLPDK